MYIPNMKYTEAEKRHYANAQKATGPVMLKPGIHSKQLRALPDNMNAAIEQFYAEMQELYPDFEVLHINTNMTFSAMLAHITFRV